MLWDKFNSNNVLLKPNDFNPSITLILLLDKSNISKCLLSLRKSKLGVVIELFDKFNSVKEVLNLKLFKHLIVLIKLLDIFKDVNVELYLKHYQKYNQNY